MKEKIILILFLAIIVSVSGCITSGDNSTGNSSIGNSNLNNQHNLSNSTSNSDPKYEASGRCYNVVDGDTIDVEGVGRIRLVGVNTPERGQPGYQNATDFVKSMVLGKKVDLDIDDAKHFDKYGRTLAVVYIGGINLNQELLKKGYAKVMYIPPSEFNPYSWT